MAVSNYSGLTINNPQVGIQITKVIDSVSSPNDFIDVANNTYFYDIGTSRAYYKDQYGVIQNGFTTGFMPQMTGGETYRGVSFNNNSTTLVTDGGVTTSASASNIAQSVASTNFATKSIRLRYYASIVQTGRYVGLRGSALLWYVTSGWKFVCDFNISDTAFGADCQQFYGMASSTADLGYGTASLIQLSTLTNLIGVGNEAGDTNLQIFYNDATGTCGKVDLGASFPANRTAGAISTTIYSVTLYNPPASEVVWYEVINRETGAIARGIIGGLYIGGFNALPSSTTGLNFFASRAMNAAITNTGQFDLYKLGVYSAI